MIDDPIVDEVRKAGEAYFAKFNFDLTAICKDLQRTSKEAGREAICRPPRRNQPAPSNGKTKKAV